jgi:hypothetical protein
MNVLSVKQLTHIFPIRAPQSALATLACWEEGSMRGEIINEYQKLDSADQKAFRRWLWANAVVGAILLTGLIALALQGDESGATAQNATMHTQAKLP